MNGGRLTSFFYVRKWQKMGMGLLLGLQIGVTFSEIRGYTFGVFGGRIEAVSYTTLKLPTSDLV